MAMINLKSNLKSRNGSKYKRDLGQARGVSLTNDFGRRCEGKRQIVVRTGRPTCREDGWNDVDNMIGWK